MSRLTDVRYDLPIHPTHELEVVNKDTISKYVGKRRCRRCMIWVDTDPYWLSQPCMRNAKGREEIIEILKKNFDNVMHILLESDGLSVLGSLAELELITPPPKATK